MKTKMNRENDMAERENRKKTDEDESEELKLSNDDRS